MDYENYVHIGQFGAEVFNGGPNQVSAWREANERFGEGGRLFREIPPSPPPASKEAAKTATSDQL